MRIVAGEFRGRYLATPDTNLIRPTTDRVRESLFAIISSRYCDELKSARVIDLFAGTGALGLEAISRGAAFCLFVEKSREAKALIGNNIDSLKLKKRTGILRADATTLRPIGRMQPFDIAFLDPPYGKGLAEKAAINLLKSGWLNPNALLVLEDSAGSRPPFLPSFNLLDHREFGDTAIRFLRPG